MRDQGKKRVVRLSAAGLRSLIREEALREAAAPEVDWDSEKGKALYEAVEVLTNTLLDYCTDDVDAADGAHPEVHSDIVACVEKIVRDYDWQGDVGAGDDWQGDVGHPGEVSPRRR